MAPLLGYLWLPKPRHGKLKIHRKYISAEMHAFWFLTFGLGLIPYSLSFEFGAAVTESTTTAQFYAPNPGLDAYWVDGEWVFGSTRANTETKSRLHAVNSDRMLVCGRPCGRAFRKLHGNVCVHRLTNVYDPQYDGWWKNSKIKGYMDWRLGGELERNYDYLRTFVSYCSFLDAQCRLNDAHGYGFAFLHMGPCLPDEETWTQNMRGHDLIAHKRKAVDKYYNNVYLADPYNTRVCGLANLGEKYEDRISKTGSCYHFSTFKARHHRQAKDYCAWHGSSLVVFDDDNERRVVREILQETFLQDFTLFIFVGISADANRVWYTVDGDLLDDVGYAPWDSGQPKNYGDSQYCGCMEKYSFRYHDTSCWNGWMNFICKKRADSALIKYT